MNFKDKLTNNLYNYIIIVNNYKPFFFRGEAMRKITNINSDWEFTINRKTETVNLPHTWNAVDGQSQRDCLRGTGVYTKTLPKYENEGVSGTHFALLDKSRTGIYITSTTAIRRPASAKRAQCMRCIRSSASLRRVSARQ